MLLLMVAATSFAGHSQVQAPQPSPFTKVEQKVGLTDLTLEYSRPNTRGRVIFGDLVPYGKVWRAGANMSSKITLNTKFTVGGKTLEAGSYAIYVIPNAKNWDIMLYTDANNWGLPENWDDSKVAAKVTVDAQSLPVASETFTINIDDITSTSAVINIKWDTVQAGFKFTVPTDALVNASIEKVMSGPSAADYYAAAVYNLQEGKDIKQAKEWMDKAITMMGDKAAFYNLRQQSLIYAKAGDKKGAIAIAKKSLEASKAAGNKDYEKMNLDSLKEWGGL